MWRTLTSPVFRNCLKTTLFCERLQQSLFFGIHVLRPRGPSPVLDDVSVSTYADGREKQPWTIAFSLRYPMLFLSFQHHIYCVTGFVQCFFMPILMSIHSDGHSPTNHTLYRTVSGRSFYIFCIEYIWCHNRENCLGNEGASNLNTDGRHRA